MFQVDAYPDVRFIRKSASEVELEITGREDSDYYDVNVMLVQTFDSIIHHEAEVSSLLTKYFYPITII